MSDANPSAENPPDILCRTAELPWIPFGEGISYKVLRTSAETGTWTVLFQCAAGSGFPAHKHHGAGEYLMLKGAMEYRAGRAVAGDYGYEPLGVFHESTTFVEDSELLFTNHGPVAFVDADMSVTMMLDWKFFADAQAQAAA
ncbi:MAG: 2,4'-dihydroxyacetophenone dioxygenase family protein [Myxococcota bacterium]